MITETMEKSDRRLKKELKRDPEGRREKERRETKQHFLQYADQKRGRFDCGENRTREKKIHAKQRQYGEGL